MQRTIKTHRAAVSDRDLSYVGSDAGCGPDELDGYDPSVVHVDARNQIIHVDREVATPLG